MGKDSPIGVFDSGLGGLTVVKEIRSLLPEEDVVYFGDIARLPYGNKSAEAVRRFSVENSLFLIEKGVKLIVVACNTASSLALDFLSQFFSVPILGVISPMENALSKRKYRKVAVIGTSATIRSGVYQALIHRLLPDCEVVAKACPLLVPIIEAGVFREEIGQQVIQHQLREVKAFSPELLLLGCTHYPIIEKQIRGFLGCEVVSSAYYTAKEVEKTLRDLGLERRRRRGKGRLRIFLSDVPEGFEELAEMFLGERLEGISVKRSGICFT